MAVLLFIFYFYPFTLLTLALNSPWIGVGGAILFLLFLANFDSQMKRSLLKELHARELPYEDTRTQAILRMVEAYAPDDFRHRVKIRIYAYPLSEPEMRIWLHSRWRFDLLVSEGFLDRARENDWIHFFQSWSTLKWSLIRRQNRLHALKAMFDRWKGPVNAYRHWWVSFWLYPLERILKISKI